MKISRGMAAIMAMALILVAAKVMAGSSIKSAYYVDYEVVINGEKTDLAPGLAVIETDKGRDFYIPLSQLTGALGLKVSFDEKAGRLYVDGKQGLEKDGAIAVVNGEELTYGEFYDRLESQAGLGVLDEMITETLLYQEARRVGVEIAEDSIEAEMAKIKENLGDQYEYTLSMYGMTEDGLRKALEQNLYAYEISTKDIVVTEAMVLAEYNGNKEYYIEPEQVRASHILVKTEEEAKAILAELKKGADFVGLAMSKSIDTSSADAGGDLGYFFRGEMVEGFEDAAFDLAAGQLSEVVETEYGYHIILCTDRKAEYAPTLEEARELIVEKIKSESAKNFDELIAELKSEAEIRIKDEMYDVLLP